MKGKRMQKRMENCAQNDCIAGSLLVAASAWRLCDRNMPPRLLSIAIPYFILNGGIDYGTQHLW